jgi:hypothetical protein
MFDDYTAFQSLRVVFHAACGGVVQEFPIHKDTDLDLERSKDVSREVPL